MRPIEGRQPPLQVQRRPSHQVLHGAFDLQLDVGGFQQETAQDIGHLNWGKMWLKMDGLKWTNEYK